MTPETKTKWLDALKSGKYPKTQGVLLDNGNGYCCLGVLIAACGPGFYMEDQQPKPLADGIRVAVENELSLRGMDYFGLDGGDHDRLIALNDRTDTFAEVIEYIEEHVHHD